MLINETKSAKERHSYATMKRILEAIDALNDDSAAIAALGKRNAITAQQMDYFQAIYDSGGDEGLRVVSTPNIIPMRLARRAGTAVHNTLSAHFAGRKALRITDEGTALGVYEIRYNDIGDAHLFPIAQLRMATATRHWYLFWMNTEAAQWWPYAPPSSGRHRFTLKTRLQQILDDRFGRFW